MNGDSTRARADAGVMLTEQLTKLAKELTRGANDTISQLNGGLISQQNIIGSYQQLLTDANTKIATQQDEIAELKKASLESRKLELDFELKRAELGLKDQRTQALINTLRDVGGVMVAQYMNGRAPAAGALPADMPANQARPLEFILADIWPRLSEETIERLKNEAGTDLIFELLTRVTEEQKKYVQQEEARH